MDFERMRDLMVERQIIARGIKDERVISAFRNVPRHKFVPRYHQNDSYDDCPLPIGSGQTISQPYMVALMTECLNLDAADKVMEIGTGSGYQAAILAGLCTAVYTVERKEDLLRMAKNIFRELDIANIFTKLGDGTLGWEDNAPYQKIIVTAAAGMVPQPLIEQLGEGGILVMPVGGVFSQELTRIRKKKGQITYELICGCSFVPLIGKYGYKDD
ncbi:MAG: protein-L-isoaspartate O-methyltransferase [Candidatus Omnitrophica bacterium CG11_big_fil_rev_8_21_14_0_20_42_13]|uniref:Protein-L-isoaspartate O-methyltransferase n=1 Tax=Candidatus Ghiorseimicrobium undicola TaxID=1974746 RepID=A0A2H0LZP5_9BACT|nr:MAG: protein-L-isoaspartate O-methyltransferase [Candidatus Omnitrophica bacterium CG11_big_fil_rev_8_21_14_0_20_42_13]